MSEKVFVVEISPVIDTAGNTQTFLFGTQAFATGPSDTPANTPVRPYLKNPGALRRELFSGARITGAITPSYGNIVLANVAPTEDAEGELDNWLNYGLSGSKIIVRYGEIGQPYPSGWTTVYIAYAQSFVADLNEITIRLRDRLQLFDRPVVASGFNGSGGLEGNVSAAKKKQFVAGVVQFIPAILIDEQKQIYFVQSTAPHVFDLTDYFAVYDNGIPIAKQDNYGSAESLLSIAPTEGYCRFYFGASSGYNILNGRFVPGQGYVFPPESMGLVRRWPARNGPVYFRLGSPPAGDIRVNTRGAPDDLDYSKGGANVSTGLFSAATFATRVDIAATDIDPTASNLFINGRYVADNTTYLDVLQDQCLASQGWFGFTRLNKFRAGVLRDPTESPNTSVYEFTQANIQNLRREPINGMEAPVWKLSVTAGQTFPSQVANGATSSVKDYLTREFWNSFQGVSETTLLQHPGAIATTLEIKGRDFFSQEGILAFLERYFVLFGGRRDFFTFTTPMTDEVLALELHDVVTLKVPRFGLSAGVLFRIVGIEINCANQRGPTMKFTLWGGQQGELTGYEGGPDAKVDEPPPINPFLLQEQMEDFSSQFFGQVRAPSDSSYIMDDFISSFIGAVTVAGSGCDSDFDNVVLLLHMDGANNSTTFTDSSSYARTVTRYNALIKTDQSKFGGASGYFDGNGDYLTYADSDDFDFGSGNFTIEAWVYLNVTPVDTGGIVGKQLQTSNFGEYVFAVRPNRKLTFGATTGGNQSGGFNLVTFDSTNAISLTTWTHVAITRNGTLFTIWIDGVANGTATASGAITNSTGLLTVGCNKDGGAFPINAYLDDVRITKGIARYTADFTIPSAAYPDGPCFGFDRTVLQLHFDGLNNTTTFTDSSIYTRTATVNGNTKISTDQSKFGGSSGYFDGNSDYLTFPASTSWDFKLKDFTIEVWFRLAGNSPSISGVREATIISTWPGSTGWALRVKGDANTTGTGIKFEVKTSGASNDLDYNTTINKNQWYHVAVTRRNTTYRLFLDGIEIASKTNNQEILSGGDLLYIGANFSTSFQWWFNGYIDELRIVKDFALYTSNFTPPTAPYPDE